MGPCRLSRDCAYEPADMDGAFPERFYSTTNYRTQVRLAGDWVEVEDQEMDCGIVLDLKKRAARCLADDTRKQGGHDRRGPAGMRVFPAEARPGRVCSSSWPVPYQRKTQGHDRAEIAATMRRTKAAGEKILAVLGPAVVHTGSVEHICDLIRLGFLDVLFAGNALATHDIEQAFFGTSLGVYLERGLPAEEGHEHHLRAINTIRRLGAFRPPSTREAQERHHVRVRQAPSPVRPGRQYSR